MNRVLLNDTVTVVIPAYGAAPHLPRVVAAVRAQSRRPDALIVVHSGGEDPTAAVLAVDPTAHVLHRRAGRFASAARNTGILAAATDWVVFVDDDVLPEPEWLGALLAAGQADPQRFVVGTIASSGTGGYWGTARWAVEFSSVHPYLPDGPMRGGASASLLVRRRQLLAAGGFPQAFRSSEDSVLTARLRRLGLVNWRCPTAMARHMDIPGPTHFFRHLFRQGRWAALARRAEPAVGGVPVRLWPLAMVLGSYRFLLTAARVASHGAGFRARFAALSPAVLLGCLTWNVGFLAGLLAAVPDGTGGLMADDDAPQARISRPSGEAA